MVVTCPLSSKRAMPAESDRCKRDRCAVQLEALERGRCNLTASRDRHPNLTIDDLDGHVLVPERVSD